MKTTKHFRSRFLQLALLGISCSSAQIAAAQSQVTITQKVTAGVDDAEENTPGGSMYITSSDLELILERHTESIHRRSLCKPADTAGGNDHACLHSIQHEGRQKSYFGCDHNQRPECRQRAEL
jgi:hypothetical protein